MGGGRGFMSYDGLECFSGLKDYINFIIFEKFFVFGVLMI